MAKAEMKLKVAVQVDPAVLDFIDRELERLHRMKGGSPEQFQWARKRIEKFQGLFGKLLELQSKAE